MYGRFLGGWGLLTADAGNSWFYNVSLIEIKIGMVNSGHPFFVT